MAGRWLELRLKLCSARLCVHGKRRQRGKERNKRPARQYQIPGGHHSWLFPAIDPGLDFECLVLDQLPGLIRSFHLASLPFATGIDRAKLLSTRSTQASPVDLVCRSHATGPFPLIMERTRHQPGEGWVWGREWRYPRWLRVSRLSCSPSVPRRQPTFILRLVSATSALLRPVFPVRRFFCFFFEAFHCIYPETTPRRRKADSENRSMDSMSLEAMITAIAFPGRVLMESPVRIASASIARAQEKRQRQQPSLITLGLMNLQG
jgi:hypothetical protein